MREREREREGGRGRVRKRERERENVSAHIIKQRNSLTMRWTQHFLHFELVFRELASGQL